MDPSAPTAITPDSITVELPGPGPAALALGADKRSGFCLAEGRAARLWLLGDDLDQPEARDRFERELADKTGGRDQEYQYASCDLHPDFFSTRLARRLARTVIPVQHHHAHFAAVLADHDIAGPALGVIFDGMGLGDHGELWGGEFLIGGRAGSRRAGHLLAIPQPGGDAAAREPWRMALSLLLAVGGDDWTRPARELMARRGEDNCKTVIAAIRKNFNAPPTTSAGRLFEAVASLLGLGDVNGFPAETAIVLERAAGAGEADPVSFAVSSTETGVVVDPRPAVRELARRRSAGEPVADLAFGFHAGLARAVVEACGALRDEMSGREVALGGGVFQNRLLSRLVGEGLERAGFRVRTALRVPAHDGGIALGQAVAARARLAEGGG